MKYRIKLTCILPGYGLREPEAEAELTLTAEQEAAQVMKGALERIDPKPSQPVKPEPVKPAPMPPKAKAKAKAPAKAPEKKCRRTRKS